MLGWAPFPSLGWERAFTRIIEPERASLGCVEIAPNVCFSAKMRGVTAAPTLEQLIEAGKARFPGLVGVEIEEARDGAIRARLELRPEHLAPNGYLHAGAPVTLADTACG